MEINKNKLKKNVKAILNYCLCVMLFLLLNNFYFLLLVFAVINNYVSHHFCPDIYSSNIFNIYCKIILGIISYAYIFFTATLCGIFKKLDKINFFIALVIILFINVLFYYNEDSDINITVLLDILYFWKLTICFLLYKFFDYLTRKFPFPFERIGYYTSIEFFKSLFKKILNKIKSK